VNYPPGKIKDTNLEWKWYLIYERRWYLMEKLNEMNNKYNYQKEQNVN